MPVKSAPYYWVECDNCGTRCEYGEFAAYAEKSYAVDEALDELDWSTDDGERFHCPSCPSLHRCERCGKPAGEMAGEREYRCQPCWNTDAVEAEAELEASRE